jgi:hypothetical protein
MPRTTRRENNLKVFKKDFSWKPRPKSGRDCFGHDIGLSGLLRRGVYLTESIHEVVLKKSTPAQIRQLIFILSIIKEKLTDFCGN